MDGHRLFFPGLGRRRRGHLPRRLPIARLPGLGTPDPKTLRLEDQQVPSYILLLKRRNPSDQETDFLAGWRMAGESRDNDPLMGSERKAEEVCKAFVARDQRVTVHARVAEDHIICRGAKTYIADILRGIPPPPQGNTRRTRQVGVDEEPDHRLATLMSSSAMTSAAYRRTA